MDYLLANYQGYKLFNGNLQNLPDLPKVVVNTINQYSYCIAEKDVAFKKVLQNSDVLLPDGVGIVIAIKATSGKVIEKISGADMHRELLADLNSKKGSCFYLGSKDSTLQKIEERMQAEYKNIFCNYYAPPFSDQFTSAENDLIIAKINEVKPHVLFVGMTAPKQEKWVAENKDRIDAKIICSIGAVFDFYAGTVERPSPFWVDHGLEWFIRLCKEPRRMWKRYLYYGPIFVSSIIKEKLKYNLHRDNVTGDVLELD